MPIPTEVLIQRILESGIVSKDELEQFLEKLQSKGTELGTHEITIALIDAHLMTRFQLARIYKGRQADLMIGNNVLEEHIGTGGMGTVYRARHRRMNRTVAIKIQHSNSSSQDRSIKRFRREVETAAKLVHQNIVTAFDADEYEGCLYLVMEFVDGNNLLSMVEQSGPFNLAKAVSCIVQAARGLHYAHSNGIVHRDIKPNNLLLDRSGTIKILDMGLARVEANDLVQSSGKTSHDSSLTGEHQIVGTVDYMSPEQVEAAKHVDHRSDIYSLGCTFYFLLTGVAPFLRPSLLQTLLAHKNDPIPKLSELRPELPRELDNVIEKMLAKDPEDRYSSMAEVIRALTPFDDDTDFHLSESLEFSLLDEDDSETKTFEIDELVSDSGSPASLGSTASQSADRNETKDGIEITTLQPLRPTAKLFADIDFREPVIGIDLGTTHSVIARIGANGRPETLANAEGDKITPSVLLVDHDEVVVGKEAVKAMAVNMPMIAECAKRELGSKLFPKRLGKHRIPPGVLLAWILKKLHGDASRITGPFQRAVVTVPAYFDEVRRRAIQDAGRLAGIEILEIINEPTAAAIAYGFELASQPNQDAIENEQVLVYDLGGGTFDVTIMRLAPNSFHALATDGDVRLGGRDWDQRLIDLAVSEFKKQFGKNPLDDPNAHGRLLRECEDAKRTLSSRKRTQLIFDYQGNTLSLELTREQFERATQDLLTRTEFTTQQTLKAAGVSWQEIDRVLLVGGASRMPAVSKMLERISGKVPDRSLSPDEAVAQGAAIRSAQILASEAGSVPEVAVQNVNSHSLGVVGRHPKTGKLQTAILLPRNTPLPARATRTFRTGKRGQPSLLVRIVEGESSNPADCSQVGRCLVHGLPKNLPPSSPVKVLFQYDESGRLAVEVEVEKLKLTQTIERENALSDIEIERWKTWLESGTIGVDEEGLIDLD